MYKVLLLILATLSVSTFARNTNDPNGAPIFLRGGQLHCHEVSRDPMGGASFTISDAYQYFYAGHLYIEFSFSRSESNEPFEQYINSTLANSVRVLGARHPWQYVNHSPDDMRIQKNKQYDVTVKLISQGTNIATMKCETN